MAAPAPAAEWTVMVYLNADNNLERFGIEDFLEMAAVGSTPSVNILVQFDRHPRYANGYGNWTRTLRYRVGKDMKPVVDAALVDLGEVDMGKGESLAAFVEWSRRNYPARRYMLDIWDHGQGWRLKSATVPEAARTKAGRERIRAILAEQARTIGPRCEGSPWNEAELDEEDRALLRDLPDFFVVPGTYKYSSEDETSHSRLYNRDLQDALETLLGGQRLDVIGFDACLMSMIETAYALRNVGTVMVGSEELEPGEGWDYSIWLGRLAAEPTMDARGLGAAIVESYRISEAGAPDVTLAAVDLGRIEGLAAAVSAMGDESRGHLAEALPAIMAARHLCENFACKQHIYHGIDLARYADELAGATTDEALKARAAAVVRAVHEAVVANYAGQERTGAPYGSHGLAIYFPAAGSIYSWDPEGGAYRNDNTSHPVEFVQKHTWDEFLHAFFERVP